MSQKIVKLVQLVLLLAVILGGWFLFFRQESELSVGDIISFGEYQWRVLELQDDKMFVISEYIIAIEEFPQGRLSHYDIRDMMQRQREQMHDGVRRWYIVDITWADSLIRQWLNDDFYMSFTLEERARIVETTVINNANPWSGVSGGNNTVDKIFLLSIEEVVQYFGDSGQLQNRPGNTWLIRDQYHDARLAINVNVPRRQYGDWWLRSPGRYGNYAAYVGRFGIDVGGRSVTASDSIRPALWLYR